MHIGVDLHLQKINSNYVDVARPEEIDWFLNEEQLRFVHERFNRLSNPKRQGLQDTQKRYDDLENLITPYSKTAYKKDNDSVFITLPPNYLHLINDVSSVDRLCDSSYSAVEDTSATVYYTPVTFPIDTTNLYSTFTITVNGTVVFNINSPTTYAVLKPTDIEESFEIVTFLMNNYFADKYSNFQVYWEYFNGIYYPNQFIFVGSSALTVIITLQTGATTYNSSTLSMTYKNSSNIKDYPNRLSKTEDKFEILRSAFAKPKYDSPVSFLEKNELIVYHNQNFIIPTIKIQYLRKPRLISLSLNQSCELNPNVHKELVIATAKRIAGTLEARNYGILSNEDNRKE